MRIPLLQSKLSRYIIVASSFWCPLFAVTDSITITNNTGSPITNYPWQFARPFVQGEIPACPKVLFDGSPITTQSDVKKTWGDGSAKHVIIAAVIASISTGAHTVTFQNQSCSNTPLTQSQMQAMGYNFEATMALTNGSTVTASALTMLNAWDGSTDDGNEASPVSLWTKGQLAQTIILGRNNNASTCNSHPCSLYDLGPGPNTSDKSFRPAFIATFWPALSAVHVRYVGEISQTEALQDQAYSLALTLGNSGPSTVYTKSSFTHTARSRWTKDFWLGISAPPDTNLNIDNNLAYLSATNFVPNYNTGTQISSGTLGTEYSLWTGQAKDITDAGSWDKSMPDAGSRSDIGPWPDWTVAWLYTGDYRMRQWAIGNADLSAAWPLHVREGTSGKIFQRGDAGSTGMGLPISIAGRPTYDEDIPSCGVNGGGGVCAPADQVSPVGTYSSGGWITDISHSPEPSSIQYLLTGDPWYYQETLWWAHWAITTNYQYAGQRGPTGDYAVMNHGQVRASAWCFRNLIEAAALAADGSAEKAYLEQSVADMVATEEGIRNITTGVYNGNTSWTFGHGTTAPLGVPFTNGLTTDPPTLHQWQAGSIIFTQAEYGLNFTTGAGTISTVGSIAAFTNAGDCSALAVGSMLNTPPSGGVVMQVTAKSCPTATLDGAYGLNAGTAFAYTDVQMATSLFEYSYVAYSIGRCKELGYACGALQTWVAVFYNGGLASGSYNPMLVGNGRVPTTLTSLGNAYLTSFATLKTEYNAAWQASSPPLPAGYLTAGPPDGYAAYMTAADSYFSNEANGTAAWAWINTNVIPDPAWADEPKWQIVARISGTTGGGSVSGGKYNAGGISARN